MSAFDWPALARLGITQLKLRPDQFWALTPAELGMMVGPVGPRPMGKQKLSALMAQFPDRLKEAADG